jgi:ATP-binding cassette subfamily C (CFTR/MRP) protein 2
MTEDGENWSVGQRQLVYLGRVLLKKSKNMMLNEATASIDTVTDGLIQQTLGKHFFLLQHPHDRIAAVLDSDMILVLSNGTVAEYDSPTKLLQDSSASFARLVNEHDMRSITSLMMLNRCPRSKRKGFLANGIRSN